MKTCFVVFLVLVVIADFAASKILIADLIDVCDARDPQLNSCFLRAANQILPFLMKGNEDIGMEPLDPLRIPRMDFDHSAGPLGLQLFLHDTIQTGLNTLNFDSASVSLKQGIFKLNGTIKYYAVRGRYTGKGRISFLPVGDGKAEFTFNNTKIRVSIQVAPKIHENAIHLEVKKLNVSYDYDKVDASLSSLFSENKRLSEAANRFLRNNAKELIHGIEDNLWDSYAKIFIDVVQKFFDQIPLNELFTNLSIPLVN